MPEDNLLNRILMQLDAAIQANLDMKLILKLHDDLLNNLRKGGKGKSTFPDPDWERFPVGRDWFTQHCQ